MLKAYKLEVWVTAVCFIILAVVGGFLSSIFVIIHETFFTPVAAPPALAPFYPSFFEMKDVTIMGFPAHYFLLIVFSWIGATVIGAVWCLVMDRIEDRQRA